VLRFSEFRTMRNHLSEIFMLNDIQITSDYMSRWVVLKRRVGAVTSQRVLRSLVQGRIHKLKNCVNSRPKSVFKDQEVVKGLSSLHDKYVIVPGDSHVEGYSDHQ
jgi:hypothetical protein